MIKLNNLEKRWHALFDNSNTNETKRIFKSLVQMYGEPHRSYHTLNHIASCLNELDEVQENIEDPTSIELSLWFHDVIYSAKEKENEEKSAIYAETALADAGTEKKTIENIGKLIRITKHPSQPKTLDEKYMIDIDLSILGAPQKAYKTYSNQIREEYSHIPKFLYSHGRKKILKAFLMSDFIYSTEYFREKYEAPAKINILNEIQAL